jgi:hypothetical protein
MKFTCIHCEQQFRITAEQFGSSGRCPHCSETVHIPAAEEHPGDEQEEFEPVAPTHWLSGSVSGMVSFFLHLVVLLSLAYFGWDATGKGVGEDVMIGEMPFSPLNQSSNEESLQNEPVESEEREEELDSLVEDLTPDETLSDRSTESLVAIIPSLAGDSRSFDLGPVSIGGDVGGGGWGNLIQKMQRHGLDVVMVFDSTSSMGGEVDEVKRQIGSIGNTLMTLVPKTRISICTYRDEGDEYLVKGLPLTNDLQEIDTFLRPIRANGGGDYQEGVQAGLQWAVEKNEFRRQARKIILLFGDAPPHPQDKGMCLRIASDFNRQQQGVVSTVSCRNRMRLSEFEEIAEVGGGEAFLTSDRKQIMTQLMVLVFGSKYRSKVIEAFRLMGE